MKKRFLFAVTMLLSSVLGAMAVETGVYFKYDPALYNQSTVVYATLVKADGSQFTADDGTYYIGAYVDGVCRAEAQAERVVGSTNTLLVYTLRVGGTEADEGKSISFRVLKVNPELAAIGGDEFEPTTTSDWTADATVGQPSNPIEIKFTPATSITLPEVINMHRNATINLLEQITVAPEGALLPAGDPVWDYANSASYVSMEGNVLKALQITGADIGAAYVGVTIGSLNAYTFITIDAPAESATWDEEYASGITLNVGEQLAQDVIARHFTTDPKDATTRFTWASGDETIMEPAAVFAGFTARKAGKTTLTATSANDDSKATLTLDVTVVQPVSSISISDASGTAPVIVVQVGDNVTERLTPYINVYPADATNKNYTIKIGEANGTLGIDDNGNIVAQEAWNYFDSRLTSDNVVYVKAADGSGIESEPLTIYVVDQQPAAVNAKKSTIYLTMPSDADVVDLTADLYNNIELTPAGLDPVNYPTFFEFSGEGAEFIFVTGEDENGKLQYAYNGAGTSTAEVFVDVLDYLEATLDPDYGVSIPVNRLTTKFDIVIGEGLSSFAFDNVETTKDATCQLVLTPQPEGAEFDASLLSVTVVPDCNDAQQPMPETWTYVAAEKDTSDDTGLTFKLTAKSIGNGTIIINYNGEPMGQGSIAVYQKLQLVNGWQWVAISQNTINDFNTAFGANLDEARSQELLVYNDPVVGYFGDLNTIEPLQAYKVKMKNLENGLDITVNALRDGASYFDYASGSTNADIALRAGWNWIGSPYQYDQKLSDALANGQFTEGDILKGKNSFAEYTANGWTGDLDKLYAGQGYLLKVSQRGALNFTPEFQLQQSASDAAPVAGARALRDNLPQFDIDGSRFADNMSMVAQVNAVSDASRCTVYAFVGDECRGQGVNVDGRQFITVHGNIGEQVSFRIYDELTGQFYDCANEQKLVAVSGSTKAPIALNAGAATNAIDRVSTVAKRIAFDGSVLDLRGLDVKRLQVVNAGGVEMVSGNEALTDLSQLPSGIYMIIVETAEGQQLTKKIVK